jgi:hypothetical protein
MRLIVGLLALVTLAFGSGCAAKQDWIDRTLVTVDVTGTRYGSVQGSGSYSGDLWFELQQQGSSVKGTVRRGMGAYQPLGSGVDLVVGTVAGDVFSFSAVRGGMDGELTVSGDEMHGLVSLVGKRQVSLQRVEPSSPPASPPR